MSMVRGEHTPIDREGAGAESRSASGATTTLDSHSPLPSPHARALLPLVLPSLVVGIFSSVLLIAVSLIAGRLQRLMWTDLPAALAVNGASSMWTFLMLTLTGVAVGLVVWRMPGHAGPDPATTGLVSAPLPPAVLPSLLVALILALAGGVSLGPENPIMALNAGVICALGVRLRPSIKLPVWNGLSAAGMVAAMFGTPVAAALILSEAPSGDQPRPLWDRLFAPLLAAGAGAITTAVLGGSSFALAVPPYPGPQVLDLFTGATVALISALIGLGGVYAFPLVHAWFYRIRNPLLMVTLGGLVLGLLGALGGPLTLFKGLDEMKSLTAQASDIGAFGLGSAGLIKLAALVVAASCGFRGGRIFPAVFVGVAIGLCANSLVPAIPMSLAVASGVLGMLLAVTHQGWLSLFLAAFLVPQPVMLPLLCVILLPVWLLVTDRREMSLAAPTTA